ncbi:hypothetical protein [Nannocystis pusilla]|uniref:hypothetical protein n=1 Tax=Nannocystis pusilla TaxID=889268 RepID=UPI003B764204
MRLYEQAIRAACDHCFVQYEALAHELAAQFYRARDLERLAAEHLRAARAAYVRWGADAKVRQLDERDSLSVKTTSGGPGRCHRPARSPSAPSSSICWP